MIVAGTVRKPMLTLTVIGHSTTVERYDPRTDTWQTVAPMNRAREIRVWQRCGRCCTG
jgi:hypothetical protein